MDGLRIGVIAARKGAEFADALRRRGASVLWGPTIQPDVPEHDPRLIDETDAVIAAQPPLVAVSTGVGVRAWGAAATRHGRAGALTAVLARATIAARGPKAVTGLLTLGLRPVFVSPNETDGDVAEWAAPRVSPGTPVVVQLHGSGSPAVFGPVTEAGGVLLPVVPYRCELPRDRAPAERLIRAAAAGDLDAVVATNATAVRNLLKLAHDAGLREGLREALQDRVAAIAVGPVTAEAFEHARVPVALMPRESRTSELLRSLAGWAERGALAGGRRVEVGGIRLEPAARIVRTDLRSVVLGDREFGVLAALVRRPGIVCSPELLAREVWGHQAPDDPTLVKHQISRLRRKLTPIGVTIDTVRAVGYRYMPVPEP